MRSGGSSSAFERKGDPSWPGKQTKLLVGPWSHSYNQTYDNWVIDFGESSLLDVEELHVRWYDYWLKGIPNGMDQEAPIRLFVMRANQWRDEHEWPLARTRWTKYYLNSGGAANTVPGDGTLGTSPPPDGAPQDSFQYDPANPVPTVGGQTEFPPDQRGPQDRRPVQKRDDVLIYSSEPLPRKLEVTGPIELKLYAASSAVDTDFTAVLTEVLADGTAIHISEGIRRGQLPGIVGKSDLDPNPERSTKSPSRSGRRVGSFSREAASGWRFPAATSRALPGI